MRALPKRLSLLSLSALVGAASFGCSFTKFDDLEDQAPGFRVKQDTSDGFGRPLVGLTRLNDEVGGTLFIAGTGGNPTLFTATFNAQGGMAGAQADREHFDDKLGLKGYGVRAMAAAPADKTLITENRPGPFVYVGATSAGAGRVIVVDINSYKPPLGGGVLSKNVSEFGTALAAAKWGNGGAEDLVVGATGAIFFLRANPWPNFTAAPDMGYSPGPNTTQVYSVVAAGDLDPTTPEDEVVAAAPDRNYVAVVYGVSSCFGGQRKTNDNKDGGSSDGASSDAGANDATTPDAT
ncbi:MAG: hypothetical protein KAI47_05435, partial [Deltaproteobacteria bacterium]|nr:hypothetical protein [Deltaproteobacteria bacterium]